MGAGPYRLDFLCGKQLEPCHVGGAFVRSDLTPDLTPERGFGQTMANYGECSSDKIQGNIGFCGRWRASANVGLSLTRGASAPFALIRNRSLGLCTIRVF